MNSRAFYLNTETRQFVGSTYGAVLSAPTFFEEDVESITLYFLEPRADSPTLQYVDYSANSVKFAVGTTTPAALQITWSAISTGVTVSVTTMTNGGAGSNEVQKITLSQKPISGGFAIVMPSRNVTVSSVSAGVFTAANHGLFNGQSVTITGFSFTGSTLANGSSYFIVNRSNDTFSLAATTAATTGLTGSTTSGGGTAILPEITTPSVSFESTPTAVQQAFVDAGFAISGAPQISVTGTVGKEYVLNFGGGCQRINFAPVTIAANTLAAAPGLSANVNFNTAGISALIAAGTTNVTMEVEVSDGTKRHTYQSAAVLGNDIITSSSVTPLINAGSSFQLVSQDNSMWTISVDNDGILTAQKA